MATAAQTGSEEEVIKLLPSKEYLIECVTYSRRTGKFVWKHRPLRHFKTARAWKRWNNVHAGTPAFCTPYEDGTLCGVIGKKIYLAHRIAWKIVTGEEPPYIIDHKNRVPSVNRWSNLRPATHGQNRANSDKTKGVYYENAGRCWIAFVGHNKKVIRVGRYKTKISALAARKIAAAKYHGEFAP